MQPLFSPEVYGSGRGIEEIAVWNLDGVEDTPSGLPGWLVLLSAAIPVGLLVGLISKEMKMAAKKKRGLSGSPAEHAEKADAQYQIAEALFRSAAEAVTASGKYRCDNAFNYLRAGMHEDGKAEAHRHETKVGYSKSATAATKAEADAIDKFRKACFASGVNIGGLKTRRRKARR